MADARFFVAEEGDDRVCVKVCCGGCERCSNSGLGVDDERCERLSRVSVERGDGADRRGSDCGISVAKTPTSCTHRLGVWRETAEGLECDPPHRGCNVGERLQKGVAGGGCAELASGEGSLVAPHRRTGTKSRDDDIDGVAVGELHQGRGNVADETDIEIEETVAKHCSLGGAGERCEAAKRCTGNVE